jgi:hypothetical protein
VVIRTMSSGRLLGSMQSSFSVRWECIACMQTHRHMTSLYAERDAFPIAATELFAGVAVFLYSKVS